MWIIYLKSEAVLKEYCSVSSCNFWSHHHALKRSIIMLRIILIFFDCSGAIDSLLYVTKTHEPMNQGKCLGSVQNIVMEKSRDYTSYR